MDKLDLIKMKKFFFFFFAKNNVKKMKIQAIEWEGIIAKDILRRFFKAIVMKA